MKKRTAVFSFKKRTKYGKNVLVGSSAVYLGRVYAFYTTINHIQQVTTTWQLQIMIKIWIIGLSEISSYSIEATNYSYNHNDLNICN